MDENSIGMFNKDCPEKNCKITNPYDYETSKNFQKGDTDSSKKLEEPVAVYDHDDMNMQVVEFKGKDAHDEF